MSQGGEGKGKRVFEVQTMISVQNNLEKTTGTGTGLRSRGKTQKRKKNRRAKRGQHFGRTTLQFCYPVKLGQRKRCGPSCF